ncbi:MAG: N-acetyltransferase [Bacteroidetes bacterium]|nr:N-acetyltransferase [Bacteroidota bacterium]
MEHYQIKNNEQAAQFEYIENGEMAKLEYAIHNNSIALMHTLVPESMKGKGIASLLAAKAFAYAQETNKKVKAYCPFIVTYVKRHPELQEQLDKDFHADL